MSKREFVLAVLARIGKDVKNMRPDDWRGLLHNWIKCQKPTAGRLWGSVDKDLPQLPLNYDTAEEEWKKWIISR